MKTTLKFLIVLALVLVAFNPYPAAGQTEVFKYRGTGVNAYFLSIDGCVRTSVYLLGAQEMLCAAPGGHEKASGVYLHLYQYNDCTATRLAQASGISELSRSEFLVSGSLDSARMTVPVALQDWHSGETLEVTIDLVWNSTTDVYHHIYHVLSSFEDCHETLQNKEDFRYAQATGAIMYGDTNLVPDPAYQATIFLAKEGQMSHGCE